MIAEHGIFQDDFLEKFDELVGQICRHESSDGGGDVISILGLAQGCLDNLGRSQDCLINDRNF
jgi:hypothetical protein